MAQDLAQDLVDLSNRGFSSYKATELSLNHGEYGFGVRPFVIVLHKDFSVEVIEMPHGMPQPIKRSLTLTTPRIAFEWYERCSIDGVDGMKIAAAGICLVCGDFVDGECLSSGFNQFGKLRSIGGFRGCSFNAGNDMSFDTAHQVGFYPFHFTSHLAVLMVEPSVICLGGKSRGIYSKVSFDSFQWDSTLFNQMLEKWSEFRILQIIECAGKRRGFTNQLPCFCLSEFGHEASARHCAVDFGYYAEYDIGQWQSWSTEFVFWLLNAVAQFPQQFSESLLFVHLCFIVDRPVLSICYPHDLSDDFRAVRPFLFPLDKLDGVDMLALLMCCLKVLAGAKLLVMVEVHHVSAVARLRRHFPAKFVLFYGVTFRYHQSSFLPLVHLITPLYIYNSILCLYLSIGFCSILGKNLLKYRLFSIDSSILCMLLWLIMNDIQTKLAELEDKNWTLAAISDELDVSYNTVQKWKAGDRYPPIAKLIIEKLDELAERKRIPKRRRYTKGGRVVK